MTSLTGYIPSSGLPENRLREFYAGAAGNRRIDEFHNPTAPFYANNGVLPRGSESVGRSHANINTGAAIANNTYHGQGFFDCLDSVDETRLSLMIAELGLYSLQELPDLRVVFAKNGVSRTTAKSRQGGVTQLRMSARQ